MYNLLRAVVLQRCAAACALQAARAMPTTSVDIFVLYGYHVHNLRIAALTVVQQCAAVMPLRW
jgi:hypothetical protein